MRTNHGVCQTLCLAQSFSFQAASEHLSTQHHCEQINDTLILKHTDSCTLIFAYGVVVHWNTSQTLRDRIHRDLLKHCHQPLMETLEDHFNYTLAAGHNRIQHDNIELENADSQTLLAISHAMAQSIKLSTFELQAQETINTTRHLPVSLAQSGTIQLSKTALAKIRGELFLTKSDINLNFDLLDTPEFFWEHPEYQMLYSMAANYLELNQRTNILSKKLETIHELLQMLADEQKHQHSSKLEWIIIWLITVEIVITLLEKVA